ncbi:hypothetical protein EV178_005423 [Coemansia sp. RSA 1646]|nr:hypothetical protein EV178_005423 [Coemansia sp. RSA 1646]
MVVIQPALAKALNDRLYDKQRAATIKIERLVLDALDADDEQRIYGLLAELSTDYATSEKEAARIGGLVALAATAVALTHINIRPFLPHIVPPIVSALSDGESKVRYFACESLYNVAKVSRGHVLRWFNDIFDGLARVTADSVKTVKDGADYLDRLIKDIVAEQAATCLDWYDGDGAATTINDSNKDDDEEDEEPEPISTITSEAAYLSTPPARGPRLAFSLDKFVPLLTERMHTYKPSTRLYLIEWIRVLDSVPGLDVIGYLPEFLDGLLRFLSDPNDDVRNKTQSLLGELLNEMTECVELQHMDDAEGTRTSGQSGGTYGYRVHASGRFTSPSTVGLPDELRMAARRKRIREERADNVALLVPGAQVAIEFARVIEILVPHLESNDLEIQGTALGWVYQLTWLCPHTVVHHVPRLVNAVLPSVSHPMATHRHTAEDVNMRLHQLVRDAAAPTRHSKDAAIEEPLNYDHAATAIMELFAKNVHEPTKIAGMQWLLLLHGKAPWRILTPEDMSFPVLLKMLSDSSEQVVRLDLELFAQISLSSYGGEEEKEEEEEEEKEEERAEDEKRQHAYLRRFLSSLLQMFATDRVLLETRAALMVRQLCAVLDPQLVFCMIAEQLCEEERADLEFISVMVQHLSWILVTAPETESLRLILRGYNAGLPLLMPHLRTTPLTTAQQQQQQVLQQVLQRGRQQQQQQQQQQRAGRVMAVPVDSQRMDRVRQTLAHAVQRIQRGVGQNKRSHALFVQLFSAWCHNPAACLTLCLLSQHYEIGAELVRVFGQLPLDLTVSFLVQLDKLVQLIESPVFTFLRLQLLDPGEQPLLMRTLYGLLMLLPQSSAFAILRNRLGSVGMAPLGGASGPVVRTTASGDLDHDQTHRSYHYNYHYHVHRHTAATGSSPVQSGGASSVGKKGVEGAGSNVVGGTADLRRIVQLLTATEQSHQLSSASPQLHASLGSTAEALQDGEPRGTGAQGSNHLPTASQILQQMAELQLCQPNKDDDDAAAGAGDDIGGGCACGCLHCCYSGKNSTSGSGGESSVVERLVAEYRSVRQRHTQAVMRSRGQQHKQG